MFYVVCERCRAAAEAIEDVAVAAAIALAATRCAAAAAEVMGTIVAGAAAGGTKTGDGATARLETAVDENHGGRRRQQGLQGVRLRPPQGPRGLESGP